MKTRQYMNNNIIIDIIIIFVFLIFFSLQIMGFYFTFLCLQYTNQTHDFMLKTNIGFRAEVCKQHASKVIIIIRRETFLSLIWLVPCVIFLANWSLDYWFHAEPLETDVTRNHCNNYLLLKKRCWCGCPFKFIPSFPNIH